MNCLLSSSQSRCFANYLKQKEAEEKRKQDEARRRAEEEERKFEKEDGGAAETAPRGG